MSGYQIGRPTDGGDRGNGFGPRPSTTARSYGAAMDVTRQHVAAQGPAAAFAGDVPTTNQWRCDCGRVNPGRRETCAQCDAPAPERTRK